MSSQANRCAVFVAVKGFALSNSRIPLMRAFLARGWKVVAATTCDDYVDRLRREGIIVECIPFRRGGFNLFSDLTAFLSLLKVYKKYQPSLIQHFNGKPIILGNLAAKWIKNKVIVNTITGLGHAFLEMNLSFKLFAMAYRRICYGSGATIFQNSSDHEIFLKNGWVDPEKSHIVVGSGVDPERFVNGRVPKSSTAPVILMAARLVWMKGISEYIEAAKEVKTKFPNARFLLAGAPDPIHPDSIPDEWINARVKEGVIEYLGYVDHPEKLLQTVSVCVLPSYREGLPRILLEAAACEVPVVTTDVPGCRETVRNGETGILVPVRDGRALAHAIEELLKDPGKARKMGERGRQFIQDQFDVRGIAQKYIAIYSSLGIDIE